MIVRHFLFDNLMKTTRTQIARVLLCLLIIAVALTRPLSDVHGWGLHGHQLSGRAAAMKLPEQSPKFFRKAVDQLSYLNPEPDRWRNRDESNLDKALDSAYAPDHFLDLELVPHPSGAAGRCGLRRASVARRSRIRSTMRCNSGASKARIHS